MPMPTPMPMPMPMRMRMRSRQSAAARGAGAVRTCGQPLRQCLCACVGSGFDRLDWADGQKSHSGPDDWPSAVQCSAEQCRVGVGVRGVAIAEWHRRAIRSDWCTHTQTDSTDGSATVVGRRSTAVETGDEWVIPHVWKKSPYNRRMEDVARDERSLNQALNQCNRLKMTDTISCVSRSLSDSSLQQLRDSKERKHKHQSNVSAVASCFQIRRMP